MKITHILSHVLMASSTTLLPVTAVLAQQSALVDSSRSAMLEEITVTAQRREQNLQDVPISVTALSADALADRNIVSTADLVKVTPGLQFGSASVQRNELFIRGVGSNRFDVGGESSSGVFLDDVYQPRFSNLLMDLLDVERVEILKGPQGTLYGRNTIGGAIAVYTPTPSAGFKLNARADMGDQQLTGGMVSASGPLSDHWSASMSAGYRSRNGFMTDLVSGKDNGYDSAGVRFKALYKPNQRVSLLFTASSFKTSQHAVLFDRTTNSVFLLSPAIVPTPEGDHYQSAYTTPGGAESRVQLASVRADYQGDALNVTSISAYQTSDTRETQDQDATQYDALEYSTTERSRALSQELRFSAAEAGPLTLGGHLKWVTGLYFFREQGYEAVHFRSGRESLFAFLAGGAGVPVPVAGILNTPSKDLTTTSYAAFGQATYSITDSLAVTAGARYTKDKKSFAAFGATNFPISLIAAPYALSAEKSWSQFTPRFSVDYHFSPAAMVYASVARGYKSGVPQSVAFNALVAARFVNPEHLRTYEVGLKSEFLNRRIRLNVAAYDNKFEDLQVRRVADLGAGVAQPSIDNAANSKIRGVEVEAAYVPTGNLRFDLGYNYLSAKYENFISSITPTAIINLSGNTMPRAPKNTASLNVRYDQPLANGGTLTFGALYSWSDGFYFQPDNTARQLEAPYATADLSLTYAFPGERMQTSAWTKNVFDQEYRTYYEDLAPSARQIWADGQTLGVTLRYKL
jgi:iron complex outermembrane recepter protein